MHFTTRVLFINLLDYSFVHFLHSKRFKMLSVTHKTVRHQLHGLWCVTLAKWHTHCNIIRAANEIDINKRADGFALVTEALHNSSSQTPQNSRLNSSSISWKLLFTLQAVLESFSKAAQPLTVTRPPFESRHKKEFLLIRLFLDTEHSSGLRPATQEVQENYTVQRFVIWILPSFGLLLSMKCFESGVSGLPIGRQFDPWRWADR